MAVLVVVFVVVCVLIGARKGVAQARVQAKYQGRKLSQVGKVTAAGLGCPNCGSTSFKAKRSAGGKLAGGVLAPKSRVRCEACGVEFARG